MVTSDGTISSEWARAVKRFPDNTAVVINGKSLTYRDLDRKSDVFAYELLVRGVEPGSLVAIKVSRSLELITAMMAVIKCAAAYLPIDVDSSVERSEHILRTTRTKYLVTETIEDPLSVYVTELIDVHDVFNKSSYINEVVLPKSYPDTPAYVMFTSGSTKEPKGVVVPHRAITRLVVNTNYIDISDRDCILQLSPVTFDASTFEIWGALLNGAKLALYSGQIFDPNLLKSEIKTYGVSIIWLTAALFHLIAIRYIEALRGIHTLLAGGDVLNPAIVRRVLTELENVTVINGYGPTENTTFTCCHRMTVENMPRETVPIGEPITGTDIFILDEHKKPVPEGTEGELYASGLGVALGYLEDMAGGFLTDNDICSALIYKTGDIVRKNNLGQLEFLGRRDRQVKVRGYRISLDEVESGILGFEGVNAVVAKLDQGEIGDQLLVAYVWLEKDMELSQKALRSALIKEFPRYMVPDKIVVRDSFPVTKNGKIDRKSIC